ncbi:hypothetical protein EVAR_74214_1 [Eumeta japonica]|uniref:Uncharacterized protein n=1 Tax=Eumeta variegata TaxID=151549 RepID=A0A4C1SF57_EUMVA|nr:hypothetical protein EVAR_74214_1 [Eumeta japonica]
MHSKCATAGGRRRILVTGRESRPICRHIPEPYRSLIYNTLRELRQHARADGRAPPESRYDDFALANKLVCMMIHGWMIKKNVRYRLNTVGLRIYLRIRARSPAVVASTDSWCKWGGGGGSGGVVRSMRGRRRAHAPAALGRCGLFGRVSLQLILTIVTVEARSRYGFLDI